MDIKVLFSAAFESFWNWLLGGIFMVIGVVTFFYPDLQPALDWPSLSDILPTFGWLAISIIIWLVGFAWNVRKSLKKEKNKNENASKEITALTNGEGNSFAAGRDNIVTITKQTSDEKKYGESKKFSPSWKGVVFLPWNPILSPTAKCGVEVINNKRRTIYDCYVELIEIYEEMEGGYFPCYGDRKAELPCYLAWEISNERVYEKIEIESTKHRYMGITYPGVGINDFISYVIKGKNFIYSWPSRGSVIAEIEVSGKMDNDSLKPKRLFVEILRQNNKFTVVEITNHPPKIDRPFS